MNWLGKVFVVVILIMSLVFMGLAMAVYATHKNWQQVSTDLNDKLTAARSENTRLQAEHNRKVEELERENTAREQQAVKLEAERVALADRLAQIQTERDTLVQSQRDHIAAVASTQKINEGLAGEVTGLRGQIKTAQQARDLLFKEALTATEELHEKAGEYNAARERSEQLTKQVAGMTVVMRDNPKHAAGESKRRKIIDEFWIDYGRCMRCNICVEVCNFEAIGMNNTWAGHELSRFDRSDLVLDLDQLLAQSKAGKVDPGLRA